MKILIKIIIFSFCSFWLFCNDLTNKVSESGDFKWGVNGGLLYGGPMPTKSTPEFSGYPIFSPFLGVFAEIGLSDNFNLQPNLIISMKGVNLTGTIRKDTLVETTIGGQTGYIPTFYTANISGLMKLTYIDLPVYLTYKFFERGYAFFGCQFSMLAGGSYFSDIHVVVGEGGFYDDITKHYNMYNDINRWDFALNLGAAYQFYNKFSLKLFATRSFFPFNKPGTIDVDKMGNMFNTYIGTSLTYDF
jgi:hypothetical protein